MNDEEAPIRHLTGARRAVATAAPFLHSTPPLASRPSLEDELHFHSRAAGRTAVLAWPSGADLGQRPYCGETDIPGPSNANPRMPQRQCMRSSAALCSLQQPCGPGRGHVRLCATMTRELRSSSTHAPRLPPLLACRLGRPRVPRPPVRQDSRRSWRPTAWPRRGGPFCRVLRARLPTKNHGPGRVARGGLDSASRAWNGQLDRNRSAVRLMPGAPL
jgi:hypothetical protein